VRQNVIVDGANLAYRTYHVLKVIPKQLTDEEGKPTGLLFGFLRSLAALRNRFVDHTFYVVWEGSRQRRSSRYPEYKAQRTKVDIYSDGQISTVREVLAHLGVWQAVNPVEEADDVIASLVRGRLQGHKNTILSTDHDFLQLVTFTDSLLTPKVGNRSEILYDPDRVVAEYGVLPDRIIHLRALLGDTSDNLPGVPGRIPTKTLTSLLRAHHSIDGIFASNLAGITANQYTNLRSAEGQVRLNLELMALQEVPFMLTDPGVSPDQAKKILSVRGLQADPIVDPFCEVRSAKGFAKTS